MKYGFGADVGGTTVKLGLFSHMGDLIEHWEIPTRTIKNGEHILPDIAEALEDCLERRGISKEDVIGIGIGATFDKVAGLAKHALMRPLGQPNPDPRAAALEDELLALVNATGIGAGALGGATTALGVRVETAPCHIAALPLAVNMGCSAMRRGTYEL